MILIYMNTGEWGGVDVFVMRFVEHLRRVGRRFVIVDQAGSRLRRDLPWADFLTPDEARTTDLSIDRVFLPSIAKLREPELPWETVRNAQVFAWVVHHDDALVQFFPHSYWIVRRWGFATMRAVFGLLPRHRSTITKMLNTMVRHHALAAMDEGTRRAIEYFYPKLDRQLPIIPVPAPVGDAIEIAAPRRRPFTFGYLGRIDEIKFSALGSLIAISLAELARTRPVRLLAITVGNHEKQLREACADAGVELDLRGFLPNHEAREVLRNQTDLGLAMGTSALDIAATGHPCIYIDPATRHGCPPQTSFRFVHETVNHTLGQYRDFPIYTLGVRSLEETVRLAMEDRNIGYLGRQYVERQHDPERINAEMLCRLDASTLSMRELEPLVFEIRKSNARDLTWVAHARSVQSLTRRILGR